MSRARARGQAGTARVWLVGVFTIAALIGAFLFGGWYERDQNPQPEPSAPLSIDLGRPGRYVALGDSYSAGEGLDPWQDGTEDVDDGGDRCHRSRDFAYSLRLTFVQKTTTEFRACSGARAEHVYEEIQTHDDVPNHLGLQVGELPPDDDVSLVTLTMGGNDLDFASVLQFCFGKSSCEDDPYKDQPTLHDWVAVHLQDLGGELVELYGKLRGNFPTARILVLGYPALFPEKAPPLTRVESAACNVLFNRWTGSEREAIRGWGVDLNATIQAATAEVDGIEFVDVHPHFTGHEPCTTGGEWVRFVGISTASAVRDGSFHPLPRGQAMMARIISCHLTVFPSADTPRTATTGYAMTGCVGQQTTFVNKPPEDV